MLKTGLTDSLCDNESFAFSNLSEEIGEVAVGVEEKNQCVAISASLPITSRVQVLLKCHSLTRIAFVSHDYSKYHL